MTATTPTTHDTQHADGPKFPAQFGPEKNLLWKTSLPGGVSLGCEGIISPSVDANDPLAMKISLGIEASNPQTVATRRAAPGSANSPQLLSEAAIAVSLIETQSQRDILPTVVLDEAQENLSGIRPFGSVGAPLCKRLVASRLVITAARRKRAA